MEQMFPSKSQTWKCLPVAEKVSELFSGYAQRSSQQWRKKSKLESIEQQKDPGRNNVQHCTS